MAGLAPTLLDVLDGEIESVLSHAASPENAIPAIQRAQSGIGPYNRDCLGADANTFLAEVSRFLASVDSGPAASTLPR